MYNRAACERGMDFEGPVVPEVQIMTTGRVAPSLSLGALQKRVEEQVIGVPKSYKGCPEVAYTEYPSKTYLKVDSSACACSKSFTGLMFSFGSSSISSLSKT